MAIASLTAVASGAFATQPMTSTLSTTSVAAGDKVDLTTQIPAVSEVGVATQEIIQSIDATKVRLTSASDGIASAGWTVTYSTDGTTFTATPSSWAAAVKVKATGSVNSGGLSADGKQLFSLEDCNRLTRSKELGERFSSRPILKKTESSLFAVRN